MKKLELLFLFMLAFTYEIKPVCGTNNIINVGILNDNLPNTSLDGFGNPFGFDIDLINLMAAILKIQVNYVVGANYTQLFAMLDNQTIDFIGTSNLAINRTRLAQYGAIDIDNTPLPCLPLVFLGPIPPVIQSPETALSDLNSINTVFGSRTDTNTIQNITLADAGVPQGNIIEVSTFTTSQEFIDGFGVIPGKYQAIYFLNIGQAESLKLFDNNINFLPCVPLAPQVQGLARGYIFNKLCCNLMINIQLALNEVIAGNGYQIIKANLLQNPAFDDPVIRADLLAIQVPPLNASITKGFIPSQCLCSAPTDILTQAILQKYKIFPI